MEVLTRKEVKHLGFMEVVSSCWRWPDGAHSLCTVLYSCQRVFLHILSSVLTPAVFYLVGCSEGTDVEAFYSLESAGQIPALITMIPIL